jgi:hypothetical protein
LQNPCGFKLLGGDRFQARISLVSAKTEQDNALKAREARNEHNREQN